METVENFVQNITEYDLWPTKIMTIRFRPEAGFNDRLSTLGLTKLSELGRLTPENHNIWDWENEDIAKLRSMYLYAFTKYAQAHGKDFDFQSVENEKYMQDAWCQIYVNGTYGNIHAHQLGDFTAVYYTSAGVSNDGSGYVQLMDPRWISDEYLCSDNFDSQHAIYPEDGTMLIFPGYVWHLVPPYTGSFPRICFATMFEWAISNRVAANEKKYLDRIRNKKPEISATVHPQPGPV